MELAQSQKDNSRVNAHKATLNKYPYRLYASHIIEKSPIDSITLHSLPN